MHIFPLGNFICTFFLFYFLAKEDSPMPYHETYTNKSNYTSVGTSHRSSKTSLLSSRLWASFDQDQNESVSDLWTRAGEMYHMLEQESQRLANKKTIMTTNTTSTSTTTTSSCNNSSRKSKTHRHLGTWNNYQQMNCLSDDNDKNTVKNLEFSSHQPYYSSPIPNCHKDMSTKAGHYNSHCTESNRDHTTVNSTKKRLQFRALCSGLRSHRSESNILCDMSGSFLSRQCFCKILAIGGSDNKSYSWKPYYMRVSGAEVRFIKASWAFHGSGRTTKTSKNKNDIIYPRNNSLGNLRDNYSSRGTLDTSKSHDDLNDDSITYYYPTYNADMDCSNNTINVNKSFSCNASCLILPIPGLIWCSEQLPANFPNWLPLGCNSNHNSNSTQTLTSRITNGINNNNTSGINPDWMDPHVSGLSQQILSDFNDCYKSNSIDFQSNTTTTNNNNNNNVNMNDEVSSRSKFRCFRFAHLTAGVELLFVFPDENAAMTCLKMCQLSGGRDYDCVVEQLDYRNASTLTAYRKKSSSNPYELFLLKLSSLLSEIPMKLNQSFSHDFTVKGNKYRVPPLANNDDDDDDVDNDYTDNNNTDDYDNSIHRDVFIQPGITNFINTCSPFITTYGPYCLMKDKRRLHRRYVIHQSSIDSDYSNVIIDGEDVNSMKNSIKCNKSDITNKFRTRTREKIDLDGIRSDNTETITNDISNNNNSSSQTTTDITPSNINNSIDDKSHSTSLIRTNKILRGFKQWLQRPVGVNNNNINSNNNASSTSNSISTNCPSVGSINFSTANNPSNTINNVITSTTGHFSGSCGSTTTSGVNYHNVNSNNNWDISSTVDVSHSESPNNDHKFSSQMTVVDPPSMTDLDSPGPVFGASLESQLESPDYPCVPVLLQAIVIALETHGLNLPGLYRKPGRHRTIAQFVSSINQHPEDIDLMFSLDAWREPNALCGLFKHFLRRLPIGLFSLSSWEPLFCLVPEIGNSSDMKQLAYLLLSIRVQLKKMAFDAFGIPTMNTMPVDVQNNSSSPTNGSSIECQFSGMNSISDHLFKPSISPPISPQTTVVPSNTSQLQLKEDSSLMKMSNFNEKEFNISKQSFRVWRWATLCFIMNHITRVVAHEHHNAVTYQCIAICFGPVFFGNSSKLPKLNEVLEHLFRHWKWLIDSLPMITKNPITNIDFSTINEPTLMDAITYLTTATDKSKQQKKPILQDHHNNNHIQRLDLTHEPINNDTLLSSSSIFSSARRKSTDVTLSQQSSISSSEQEQQLIVDYDLTVKKFDNEDELNKEVIEQVRSLWLKALDKMNNESHRNLQMKEKSPNHKKTINHSNNTNVTLHRTASAIPKKSTERNRQKGVRRLTVGVANSLPHSSSTLDYYCISPPSSQILHTKNKEEDILLTQLNNVKNISNLSSLSSSPPPPPSSSLSTSPPPPPPHPPTTSRCDLMIVRRPVIPVTTSHTTTTIS
ncbi:unnamed protein product [Schistosoma spindalis]|nr:unnamed protein product [Schistosoma spindale]